MASYRLAFPLAFNQWVVGSSPTRLIYLQRITRNLETILRRASNLHGASFILIDCVCIPRRHLNRCVSKQRGYGKSISAGIGPSCSRGMPEVVKAQRPRGQFNYG